MRNAIPFKAEVVLALPKANVKALEEMVAKQRELVADEFKLIEKGVEFFCEPTEAPTALVPVEIQDNLINAITACHDGVIRFIPAYPNVVETSSNLAIIEITPASANIKVLARSSREDMKEVVVNRVVAAFDMAGMKSVLSGSYGGWDPNPNSEILNMMKRIYKEQNGEEAIVQVDHAGLECSIILGKYPGMDVVSFGPTIRSPHTSTERAEIASTEPFWKLLVKALEEVPVK